MLPERERERNQGARQMSRSRFRGHIYTTANVRCQMVTAHQRDNLQRRCERPALLTIAIIWFCSEEIFFLCRSFFYRLFFQRFLFYKFFYRVFFTDSSSTDYRFFSYIDFFVPSFFYVIVFLRMDIYTYRSIQSLYRYGQSLRIFPPLMFFILWVLLLSAHLFFLFSLC